MRKSSFRYPLTVSAIAGALSLLTACGDTGGGAGDAPVDTSGPLTPSVVEPFVGVYDLLGNWNGMPDDQAYLVIRNTDTDGTSGVALYDADEVGNCFFRPQTAGEVIKDPVSERVFMNEVFPFSDAVLTLEGSTLNIRYFDEAGTATTYRAPVTGLSETDIGPQC